MNKPKITSENQRTESRWGAYASPTRLRHGTPLAPRDHKRPIFVGETKGICKRRGRRAEWRSGRAWRALARRLELERRVQLGLTDIFVAPERAVVHHVVRDGRHVRERGERMREAGERGDLWGRGLLVRHGRVWYDGEGEGWVRVWV